MKCGGKLIPSGTWPVCPLHRGLWARGRCHWGCPIWIVNLARLCDCLRAVWWRFPLPLTLLESSHCPLVSLVAFTRWMTLLWGHKCGSGRTCPSDGAGSRAARAALCCVLPSHLLPGPAVKPGTEGREGSSGLAEQAAARGDPGTAPTAGSSGLLCSPCQTPFLTPSHPEQDRRNPATLGVVGSAPRIKPLHSALGHKADVLPGLFMSDG